MGRGFLEYKLPDSGREEWVLWSAFIDYRLPDGSKLHIMQQPAWCAACRRFVIAEEVPTVEWLQAEISRFQQPEFQQPDSEAFTIWAFVSNNQPVAERIEELRRYIEWRQSRQSPPRCLECGSLELTLTPMDGEFAHPATGERVVVGGQGWADTGSWSAEFSPEGVQLHTH